MLFAYVIGIFRDINNTINQETQPILILHEAGEYNLELKLKDYITTSGVYLLAAQSQECLLRKNINNVPILLQTSVSW